MAAGTESNNEAAAPELDPASTRKAKYTAIVLASAMFMVGLDSTVLLTALPRMAIDFHEPATALSSTITIYVLVSAILVPLSNWVAQRLGPRRVFMAAIVGFAISSMGCGLSPNLPVFLLMRVFQAASGSLMVPVGNIVLLKVTPRRYLVTAMAISSTPALIAPVIGPPLGGFITTFFEWPWVFFINAPIALIGLLSARRFIPHVDPEARTPFDFKGFFIIATTLVALIGGLDRLADRSVDWRLGASLLVAGFFLAIVAIRHARRAAHPIVPLSPLRHPCFSSATLGAGIFVRFAFAATGFTLPLMLQIGMGLSAFQAGILLLAQNAGDLLLKPVAGKALRLMGFRTALTSGTLTMAITIAGSAFLTPQIPFLGLCAILFVVGNGRSILFTALMALRFADVPQNEIGGATVLGNMVNAVIQAMAISGAALLLNMLSGSFHDPDLASFRDALLVLAAIAALGAPFFALLHADAGAEVSGKPERASRGIEGVEQTLF